MSVGRMIVSMSLLTLVAAVFFTLGNFVAARHAWASDAKIDALRADMLHALNSERQLRTTGTSGAVAPRSGEAAAPGSDARARSQMVEAIKRELQAEMGLVPVKLLRDRRESFVELYSYDSLGGSSYGTAGYLGGGYFITVKHAVLALGPTEPLRARRIVSVRLIHKGNALKARVIDAGDAVAEVDAGDWAILKVREQVDLPPLRADLKYDFTFADPIFRLGNDYSKGIILGTGYVGQKTASGLVTCLTDGHPGVSGGGVLNQAGDLVGIPIGRMQGDFRFSFILPLRREMFRKVEAELGN